MCFFNLLTIIKHGAIIKNKEEFHGKHNKCCARERVQKSGGVAIARNKYCNVLTRTVQYMMNESRESEDSAISKPGERGGNAQPSQ